MNQEDQGCGADVIDATFSNELLTLGDENGGASQHLRIVGSGCQNRDISLKGHVSPIYYASCNSGDFCCPI